MTCPRCTQALPGSAEFCRRCGLNVRAVSRSQPPPPARGGRSTSLLGPALGIGIVALIVVGLVGVYGALAVHESATVSPYNVSPYNTSAVPPNTSAVPSNVVITPVIPQTNYAYTPPRAYPPTMSTPPGYPLAPAYPPFRVTVPTYPARSNPQGHEYVEQRPGRW